MDEDALMASAFDLHKKNKERKKRINNIDETISSNQEAQLINIQIRVKWIL
jgi:hypothetical protein